MLKIIKVVFILFKSSKFLFLASGVKNDEGFWLIGVKNSDENILDDKYLLDCHRKELIGNESAKDIISAINLNLNNIFDELEKHKFLINQPSLGISFNIPLNFIENIFDFWLDNYKDREVWETCFGLLKIRRRVPLTNLINSKGIRGDSKKWALQIEELHTFKPNSIEKNITNDPMWK